MAPKFKNVVGILVSAKLSEEKVLKLSSLNELLNINNLCKNSLKEDELTFYQVFNALDAGCIVHLQIINEDTNENRAKAISILTPVVAELEKENKHMLPDTAWADFSNTDPNYQVMLMDAAELTGTVAILTAESTKRASTWTPGIPPTRIIVPGLQ